MDANERERTGRETEKYIVFKMEKDNYKKLEERKEERDYWKIVKEKQKYLRTMCRGKKIDRLVIREITI